MDNFFENHIEEINSVIKKSKKESKISIIRLQKASVYKLESYNGKILNEDIYHLEGLNLHQITEDGKILIASSDRTHLNDIVARLYQEIDDILKSYKSHKVHSSYTPPTLSEKNSSKIKNIDIYDWNNIFLKNTINNLYEAIDKIAREKLNITFRLDGYYALWSIFNQDEKANKFDEYFLYLNFTAESKGSGERILSKNYKINVSEIKNRKVGIEQLVDDINDTLHSYIKSLSLKQTRKFDANVIVLDDSLTTKILTKLLLLDPNDPIFSQLTDENSIECIEEDYDKFGNQCLERIKIKDGNRILRQCFFYENPRYSFRNIFLNKKDSNDIQAKNIDLFLQEICDKLNIQKVIFLKGSKDTHIYDDHFDDIIIEPSIKFYFDGKSLKTLDFDYIEIIRPYEINFAAGGSPHIYKLGDSNMLIGASGFNHSLFSTHNIKFI